MQFLEIMHTSFRGEKLEAALFIAPAGLALAALGVAALRAETGSFAWSVAIPCFLFALVLLRYAAAVQRLAALMLLAACSADAEPPIEEGPLGIPLSSSGRVFAGAAVVDITPSIVETFTDLDDNAEFNGCLDAPEGGTSRCPEPFDDVDGDGVFDAVWMGGFSPLRPANTVADPISARALVLSSGGEYVVFVSLDLIGLLDTRIHAARDRLAGSGLDPDRLVVASTHNHAGPDTLGFYGNPFDLSDPISGLDPAYQERLVDAIDQVVRDAAMDMTEVDLRVGSVRMRDLSPDYNGAAFGGTNPTAKMHGAIHDIRDPVIVSDQVLALQGKSRRDGDGVFVLTSWSGHPEVWGDRNNAISADFVGVTRSVLESRLGGTAIHLPEALGGMQSALGGDIPLVAADGTPVPGAWAEHDSEDFVRSLGHHVADAAVTALDEGEAIDRLPIRVQVQSFWTPLSNLIFNLLVPLGVLDVGPEVASTDPAVCPEAAQNENILGCFESRTFRISLGPIGIVTAPGEVLPELAWGLPVDDPIWEAESNDITLRGEGSRYFPQHDPLCNDLPSFATCKDALVRDDCDCTKLHAWPYATGPDASVPPVLDLLEGAKYRAVVGAADSFYAYMVPEVDFNKAVNVLSDEGDHYEETVSASYALATRWQQAQLAIGR